MVVVNYSGLSVTVTVAVTVNRLLSC